MQTVLPAQVREQRSLDEGTLLPPPEETTLTTPAVVSNRAADPPRRSRKGILLLWSAALTCPCHFPLIVLLLLGETALGAYLHAHLVLLFGLTAAYFSGALLAGMWLVRQPADPTCAACKRFGSPEPHE